MLAYSTLLRNIICNNDILHYDIAMNILLTFRKDIYFKQLLQNKSKYKNSNIPYILCSRKPLMPRYVLSSLFILALLQRTAR